MTKTEFETGDIVTIFGNPIKMTHPIGQARLIRNISDDNSENTKSLQQWQVEFLNDEGHYYNQFIKKLNGKK